MSSFDVSLYRLLHRGNPGDRAFYRAFCRGTETVLELGCGDGRVALGIAADGARVTGLDAHPGMIEAAEAARAALPPEVAARVHLVSGDMARFELDARFDRVIIPYTGLYCLADDAEVARCFRAIRRHLAPGGRLAFDGYVTDQADDEAPSLTEAGWLTRVHDGDTRIDVFEQGVHDPAPRTYAITYRHDIRAPEGRRTAQYTLRHHYLMPSEISALLAGAGLRLDRMWGDFYGAPLDDDADRVVVEASAEPDLIEPDPAEPGQIDCR